MNEEAIEDKVEEIENLEVEPSNDWFVETQDPQGQRLVYLRIQVTGLLPRRVGPFPNRERALLALDWLAYDLFEVLDSGFEDRLHPYLLKRRFHHRSFHIRAVDKLGQAYLQQSPFVPTTRPVRPNYSCKNKEKDVAKVDLAYGCEAS